MYRPILSLKPKRGFLRTRVSCITLLAALALSSFAERGGEERQGVVASVQRAEFLGTRGRQTARSLWPRPKRSLEDRRGVRTVVAHRLGRTYLPDGIRSGERSNSPPCASIGARARSCGGVLLRRNRSKRSTNSAAPPPPRLPPTESGSMFTSGLTGWCVTTWTEIRNGKGGSLCRKTPMARSLHRLSPANCWCSTIKGKTPTCSASIAATAGPSGRRTARCFSTDGQLPCIGVTTGSTRLSCWEATSSRTSV